MDTNKIKTLAEYIKTSKNTVFFGGAGVSTESGIPDFRSEKGLYSAQQVYGYSPEMLLSRSFFRIKPELFFKYYKENLVTKDAKPNAAHIALARFEKQGLLSSVITQNVDGLHQLAGSKNVFELHGSNWRQYCMNCRKQYSFEYILDENNCRNGITPICKDCGGVVRPDVVLYEERLKDDVINSAINAIEKAEVLIIGGTSLAVYPANGLINYYLGGNLVLINKSETAADMKANLIIREPIGEVFEKVMAEI